LKALAAGVLRLTTKKGRRLFLRKKVHPGDLAGGLSDLEMTWLLYCAGTATVLDMTDDRKRINEIKQLSSQHALHLPV